MLSTIEKVLFLKSIELFNKINGEDLAQIADISKENNFEKGELIIQQDELGDSMYIIIEGEVLVHRTDQQIARLHEREAFGEMAILDHEPRSASVTAVTDISCLKIEREDFYALMSDKPEIAYGIIRVLTQRLRAVNQLLSSYSAQSRQSQNKPA